MQSSRPQDGDTSHDGGVGAVKRVHVVFKTHLDIGYTARPWAVVDRFLDNHVPAAIATSRMLRERGGTEMLTWTLGSWVVDQALTRVGADQQRLVEEAVNEGFITWHGLPLSLHSELLDSRLFESGLGIAARLDRRFGRKTIAAKMTDVPGHTVGIVPALVRAGLRFLHIGVNPQSTVPSVPPSFRWRGADGSEIVVAYNDEYGGVHRRRGEGRSVRDLVRAACLAGETNPYRGAVRLPGSSEALLVYMTGDNVGPPSVDDVLDTFAVLAEQFPGAEIVPSTLDAYARAALEHSAALPVVTEEIGDSWIHGAGADPLLLARYRELLRVRRRFFTEGRLNEAGLEAVDRHLLLVPEHTFGFDPKAVVGAEDPYDASGFVAKLASGAYQVLEDSWADKAAHVVAALEAIEDPTLRKEASDALAAIDKPVAAHATGSTLSLEEPLTLENGNFALELDPTDGSLRRLFHKPSGRNWANSDHRLFSYQYQTFSVEDYEAFFEEYIRPAERKNRTVVVADFGKLGLDRTVAQTGVWPARLDAVQVVAAQRNRYALPSGAPEALRPLPSDRGSVSLLTELVVPVEPGVGYGAPKRLRLIYTLPEADEVLHVELQRLDKAPCRLPEAEWISCRPLVSEAAKWRVDKLGTWISTEAVVAGGGGGLHAVGTGVKVDDGATLTLETMDAALVAPGRKSLLRPRSDPPKPGDGVYVNLSNNVWGTNFRAWNSGDISFRFRLSLA